MEQTGPQDIDVELDRMPSTVMQECLDSSKGLVAEDKARISELGLSPRQYRFVFAMLETGFNWNESYRMAGFKEKEREGYLQGILRLKRDGRVMRALGVVANSIANKVSVTKDWAIAKCKGWVEDQGVPIDLKLKALKLIGEWQGWSFTGKSVSEKGLTGVQIIIGGSASPATVKAVESAVLPEGSEDESEAG